MDKRDDRGMVLRTVYLPVPLDDRLRALAYERRISKGELIRELVTASLDARTMAPSDQEKGTGETGRAKAKASPKPAVPIEESVTPDYLVCLEDGKKLKMLRRHLRVAYDMTPEEYRARWKLPADYPMVAPDFAAKRRQAAQRMGLGARPQGHAETRRVAKM